MHFNIHMDLVYIWQKRFSLCLLLNFRILLKFRQKKYFYGNFKPHHSVAFPWITYIFQQNGPLARYAKLRVAHAPGMSGTFSPPPRFIDPNMHHGTCVMHVPWCTPGSITSDFLWSGWREKRSWHSRRMRNPQFYVSGKRPILIDFALKQYIYESYFFIPVISIIMLN